MEVGSVGSWSSRSGFRWKKVSHTRTDTCHQRQRSRHVIHILNVCGKCKYVCLGQNKTECLDLKSATRTKPSKGPSGPIFCFGFVPKHWNSCFPIMGLGGGCKAGSNDTLLWSKMPWTELLSKLNENKMYLLLFQNMCCHLICLIIEKCACNRFSLAIT